MRVSAYNRNWKHTFGGTVMEYRTVQETADKWKVSKRMVQQLCAAGRIPGARKFTRAWAIPADAEKPQDPRLTQPNSSILLTGSGNLMPLMNSAFVPGHCRATAESMAEGAQRNIALAEYHYFTGKPEAAAHEAEPYLNSADPGARLSACLLCAYANLSLGRIQQTRFALSELNAALSHGGKSPETEAASAFVAAAGAVLLHLPLPAGLPDIHSFLPLLPSGLRAFSLYVYAHYQYLQGDYASSAGIVEGTLAMGAGRYPIPAIYLHLVAVMDYMGLKQTDKAQTHLLCAWALARPDDLIEGFGEHHGLLGGMLEAVIKPEWPEDFKRIIDITYRFSAGWRRVHNPETGHDVADDLTTTEFAVCMLAARGWNNPDIAEHLHISLATVKRHLSNAMKKLDITRRGDLQKFMLQ